MYHFVFGVIITAGAPKTRYPFTSYDILASGYSYHDLYLSIQARTLLVYGTTTFRSYYRYCIFFCVVVFS